MKLLIIGAVGSGKTTLAKKISAASGVPTYQLEKILYEVTPKGRRKRSKKELLVLLTQIDLKGPWIMEGTPHKAYAFLYGWADKIFWLDPPVAVRGKRILKRFVKYKFLGSGEDAAPTVAALGKDLLKNAMANTNSARGKLARALAPYEDKVIHIKAAEKVQVPPPKQA